MPEIWGHDIEVPDNTLYRTRCLSKGEPIGDASSEKAASIFTPEAVISD